MEFIEKIKDKEVMIVFLMEVRLIFGKLSPWLIFI